MKLVCINVWLLRYKIALTGIAFLLNILVYSGTSIAVETVVAPKENRQALTIEDLRGAARESVEKCLNDLEAYCQDVTPGKGKIFACLHSHKDKLSDPCLQALGLWELPDIVPRFKGASLYPTLEQRELGQVNLDEGGERVIWDHPLPFFAQDVIDLGFDLPRPFGVALIPGWIRQDLVLDQLAISINNGSYTNIDFVDFGTPEVENTTLQLKIDAWVFPFLNAYATLGKLNGKGTIPITLEGTDLLPSVCSVTPNLPVCVRTYSAIANVDYHGDNLALGMTLAMGWKEYFVAIPITYAWSDVNIIDTTVTTLHISPRIGITSTVASGGLLSAFFGATYLDTEVDLAGTVVFDTPGAPSGDTTTIDFNINQRNKDKWNLLLGFNWDISKQWSVMLESGFGGSRQNLVSGVTYRF